MSGKIFFVTKIVILGDATCSPDIFGPLQTLGLLRAARKFGHGIIGQVSATPSQLSVNNPKSIN